LSQSSQVTDGLLDDIASGTSAVVPVLWAFEVANSLLVLQRRKRISVDECARARQHLASLPLVVDDDGPRLALSRTAQLAEQHGLSVYAAAYLELAARRGVPLASRDAALNKAAKLAGVKTLL
jgi:predicted nucleic acid-binding protein